MTTVKIFLVDPDWYDFRYIIKISGEVINLILNNEELAKIRRIVENDSCGSVNICGVDDDENDGDMTLAFQQNSCTLIGERFRVDLGRMLHNPAIYVAIDRLVGEDIDENSIIVE